MSSLSGLVVILFICVQLNESRIVSFHTWEGNRLKESVAQIESIAELGYTISPHKQRLLDSLLFQFQQNFESITPPSEYKLYEKQVLRPHRSHHSHQHQEHHESE